MSMFNDMDKIVDKFNSSTDNSKKCKGENCKAVKGKSHSDECIKNHDKAYGVPDCFDRAESGGRLFDNCLFFRDCKQAKPICANNPITQK